MFYLYKKTHAVTGMQYLGYTKKDPFEYKGSGTVWQRHINKYGDEVITEVLHTCETKEEIKEAGRYYSTLWNIVESDEWANLKAEEADGGDMRGSSTWVEGRHKQEFRDKQALRATGNTNVRGKKWWSNVHTGELRRVLSCPGPDWVLGFLPHSEENKALLSSKLKGRSKSEEHKQKLSVAAKGRMSNNKGTVWVVDRTGNRRRVKPDAIPEGYTPVTKKE